MKSPKQQCPICNQMNVELNSRYPKLVCSDCFSKTTDKDGRKIYFFNDFAKSKDENNTFEWIGPGAKYLDTKEPYTSLICYIEGIKCQANEGRFGGIVIEAVSNIIERNFMFNQEPYWKINREERFYVAILFSALLSNRSNIEIFLKYLSSIQKLPLYSIDQCELYYEYTYLRDMWFNIGGNDDLQTKNFKKRDFILNYLELSNSDDLKKMDVSGFNNYFGTSRPSSDEIMSPGTWSIPKYAPNISNNHEFINICKFKWSFNAKPDLVIHLDNKNVVCIEAKLESLEGHYPSSQKDRNIYQKKINQEDKKNLVSQTELQKYMFEKILLFKQFPYFLCKYPTDNNRPEILWTEIFERLSVENMHPFIKNAIETLKSYSKSNNISDESNEIS